MPELSLLIERLLLSYWVIMTLFNSSDKGGPEVSNYTYTIIGILILFQILICLKLLCELFVAKKGDRKNHLFPVSTFFYMNTVLLTAWYQLYSVNPVIEDYCQCILLSILNKILTIIYYRAVFS